MTVFLLHLKFVIMHTWPQVGNLHHIHRQGLRYDVEPRIKDLLCRQEHGQMDISRQYNVLKMHILFIIIPVSHLCRHLTYYSHHLASYKQSSSGILQSYLMSKLTIKKCSSFYVYKTNYTCHWDALRICALHVYRL